MLISESAKNLQKRSKKSLNFVTSNVLYRMQFSNKESQGSDAVLKTVNLRQRGLILGKLFVVMIH